jgi:hypothetical protein
MTILLLLSLLLCGLQESSTPYIRGFFYPTQHKMRLVVDESFGVIDSVVTTDRKGLNTLVLTDKTIGFYGEQEYLLNNLDNIKNIEVINIYSNGEKTCAAKLNENYNQSYYLNILVYK